MCTSLSHMMHIIKLLFCSRAEENRAFPKKSSLLPKLLTDCFLIEFGRWIIWWIRKKNNSEFSELFHKGNCGIELQMLDRNIWAWPCASRAADLCCVSERAWTGLELSFQGLKGILSQRPAVSLGFLCKGDVWITPVTNEIYQLFAYPLTEEVINQKSNIRIYIPVYFFKYFCLEITPKEKYITTMPPIAPNLLSASDIPPV